MELANVSLNMKLVNGSLNTKLVEERLYTKLENEYLLTMRQGYTNDILNLNIMYTDFFKKNVVHMLASWIWQSILYWIPEKVHTPSYERTKLNEWHTREFFWHWYKNNLINSQVYYITLLLMLQFINVRKNNPYINTYIYL